MDIKLSLKPIELIDIGIDKHTKMPVPIQIENIVPTDNIVNNISIN